jgi:RHS repeat-associated protein
MTSRRVAQNRIVRACMGGLLAVLGATCSGYIEGLEGSGRVGQVIAGRGMMLLDLGEGNAVTAAHVAELDDALRSGSIQASGGTARFGEYELALRRQQVTSAEGDQDDSALRSGAVYRAHWACEPTDVRCRYVALQDQGRLDEEAVYELTLRSTSTMATLKDYVGVSATVTSASFTVANEPKGLSIPKDLAVTDAFSGRASAKVPFDGLVGGPQMGLSYSSFEAESGRALKYDSNDTDDRDNNEFKDFGQAKGRRAFDQRLSRKSVSSVGRGWKVDGISYLVGSWKEGQPRRLVLNGATYTLVHVGGTEYRTQEYSGLVIDWHSEASATVYSPDGSVYEFGGFRSAGTMLKHDNLRSQYRCHKGRGEICAVDVVGDKLGDNWRGAMEYKSRQGVWARNRFMAHNQWLHASLYSKRGRQGDEQLRAYRLYLRKSTNGVGRAVYYLYNLGVAQTSYAPNVTEVRLSRVIWAADPARMQAIEQEMELLAQRASYAETRGDVESGRRNYHMRDCVDKNDRFNPAGETDDDERANWNATWTDPNNGRVTAIGCTHYPQSMSGLPSVASELKRIESALESVTPRMELRFSYGERQDGIYENENDANWDVIYEAYSGKWLKTVEYRVTRPGDQAPVTVRGWDIQRAGGDIDADGAKKRERRGCLLGVDQREHKSWNCDDDEEKSDTLRETRAEWQNIAAITPWVGSSGNALPAFTFEYEPSTSSTSQYKRGLLKRMTNGYGGVTEFEYLDRRGETQDTPPDDDKYIGLGLVSEQTDYDGDGGYKRLVYARRRGSGQGFIQDQWGGSRQVVISTYQKAATSTAATLESCTEQRYFTNDKNDGDNAANYVFADGLASSTSLGAEGAAQAVNDWGHRMRGLEGRMYQAVQWVPTASDCPTPQGDWLPTEWKNGALQDDREYYVVDFVNGDVNQGIRTQPAYTLKRAFARNTGEAPTLSSPAQELWTRTTYTSQINPRETFVYQGGTAAGGPTYDRILTKTKYEYSDPDGEGVLAERVIKQTTHALDASGSLTVQGMEETTYKAGVRAALIETLTTYVDDGTSSGTAECPAVGASVTRTEYDDWGNVTRVTDANGGRTTSEYDPIFHTLVVKSTNVLGQTTLTQYGSTPSDMFAPTRVVGPFVTDEKKAPVVQHGYDAIGRPVWSKSPVVTSYSVTRYGGTPGQSGWWTESCALASDSTGANKSRCTTTTVNGWGAVTREVTPDGLIAGTRYDGLGRVIATSAPHAATLSKYPLTTTVYSVLDGSVTTTAPSGVATRTCPGMSLDSGIVESEVRIGKSASGAACSEAYAGRKHRSAVDAMGRVVRVTEYDVVTDGDKSTEVAAHTTYDYDGLGRLVKVVDAANRAHESRYNWAGHEVWRNDPDAGETVSCVNAAGLVVAKKTAASQKSAATAATSAATTGTGRDGADAFIRTSYDMAGRVQDVKAPDGSRTTLIYDERAYGAATGEGAIGKLTRAVHQAAGVITTLVQQYDAHGRLVRVRHAFHSDEPGAMPVDVPMSIAYDAYTGETVCQDYPYGTSVHRTFDGATGRLLGISMGTAACANGGGDRTSLASSLVYNELGQLTSVTTANESVQTRAYDTGDGRLTSVGGTKNGASVLLATYGYDNDQGLVGSISEGNGNDKTTYEYDHRARLTKATREGSAVTTTMTWSYAYDALGNLTYSEIPERKHHYSPSGLLTGVGPEPTNLTWELHYVPGTGMVERKTDKGTGQNAYALTYDAFGQVRRVVTPGRTTDRFFGYGGLWVVRTQPASTADATTEPARTIYFGPGGYEEEEMRASGSITRRIVVQGPMGPIVLQAQGTGAMTVQSVSHVDHVGSTRAVTTSAATSPSPRYRPFGGRFDITDEHTLGLDDSNQVLHGFTGQRSREYGPLYDYGARMYDPELGRFLQPDPVIPDLYNPQDYNAYAYVRNNPLANTDPSGAIVETALDVASVALSAWDFYQDPTWANAGWLALDVVSAIVPFLPAIGAVRHGAKALTMVSRVLPSPSTALHIADTGSGAAKNAAQIAQQATASPVVTQITKATANVTPAVGNVPSAVPPNRYYLAGQQRAVDYGATWDTVPREQAVEQFTALRPGESPVVNWSPAKVSIGFPDPASPRHYEHQMHFDMGGNYATMTSQGQSVDVATFARDGVITPVGRSSAEAHALVSGPEVAGPLGPVCANCMRRFRESATVDDIQDMNKVLRKAQGR